jgi:uncharacterized membrane protein YccC
MSQTRPRTLDTQDLARVEDKLDNLFDLMVSLRFDLDDLRADLRLRDARTDQMVAALRRAVAVLGRRVRSIHGAGGPEGRGRE